ncbi:hypothetical protein DSO57_1025327 [Entomophthora muscae]|uniref:Uncharacterized protein n=1 Tax=Entomophthora muscae TaxID=34485 RepID=A0ACC2TQ83_9FUNG|nr:hypothetical protein DSO57_1025327 [Entomophthora muscae]
MTSPKEKKNTQKAQGGGSCKERYQLDAEGEGEVQKLLNSCLGDILQQLRPPHRASAGPEASSAPRHP